MAEHTVQNYFFSHIASVNLKPCRTRHSAKPDKRCHPSDPVIYESYLRSAYGYVELAEKTNGFISKPVVYSYIWGDALAVLDTFRAEVEQAMREDGALIGLRDWALKLHGAVVRIAGIDRALAQYLDVVARCIAQGGQ